MARSTPQRVPAQGQGRNNSRDDEGDAEVDPTFPVPPPTERSAEELKDYLANLPPEDFGKFIL